jgi:Tfp pilus assembly protein PilO
MNNLTKIIGISVVAFAAVIMLLMFLARPILAQISTIHQQEAQQKTELDQLGAQIHAYNEARAQLKEVNYTDKINNAVLVREDLAQVIREVEAVALTTKITESISIQDDEVTKEKPKALVSGEKNITEVQYTLSFNGAFPDTLTFMQYLEHLSHFTELSKLTFMSTVDKTTGNSEIHSNFISGSISGVFFVKKK